MNDVILIAFSIASVFVAVLFLYVAWVVLSIFAFALSSRKRGARRDTVQK